MDREPQLVHVLPRAPGDPCWQRIAVAKLAACVRLEDVPAKIAALSSVAGPEGSFRTWEEILGHRYAEGPFCWVLEDVRPVEHVAIRGAQGLWQLPDGLVLEEAKGGGW